MDACNSIKLVTVVEGDPKAPFSIATTPWCKGEDATPFPGLLYPFLDPYLIMLRVKQEGIKYRFLSLCYDSTWGWTQVFRAISEHSNHHDNVRSKYTIAFKLTFKVVLKYFWKKYFTNEFKKVVILIYHSNLMYYYNHFNHNSFNKFLNYRSIHPVFFLFIQIGNL